MAERPGAGDFERTSVHSSAGFMKLVIAVTIAVVVCAGIGVGIYFVVLAPRLQESSGGAVASEGSGDSIPETAVAVDLPEAQAAAAPVEPNEKSTVLTYTVSVVCNNEETKVLVEKNKQFFIAMFVDLFRNKTKAEMNDPEFQKSILQQALEEGNSILRRMQKKPNPEIKIYQTLFTKYAVFTLP